MAIGLFGNKGNTSPDRNNSNDDKKDVELGGLGTSNGHDAAADDSDQSISVGKQMEMEADNAIKYRTCSWQKVCFVRFVPSSLLINP
jgi:hypothetical protein